MADEYRVKLGRGASFKISLSKKPVEDQDDQFSLGLQAAKSGLMGTYQPGDEEVWLPEGGYLMNIYDLGQINTAGDGDDPVWAMLDWSEIPDVAYDEAIPIAVPLTFAQWNAMISKIFEVDVEDPDLWKNKYRRLDEDDGFKFGVDLVLIENIDDVSVIEQGKNYFSAAKNDQRQVLYRNEFESEFPVVTPVPVANSKWTDDGLKLKKAIKNIVALSGGGFVSGFHTNPPSTWQFFSGITDPGYTKITETNSYAAAAVTSLSIKSAVDLFLVPLPGLLFARYAETGGDFIHYLIGPYEIINRPVWAYDDVLSAEIGTPALAAPVDQNSFTSAWFPRAVDMARQVSLSDFYKARANAVYSRLDTSLGTYDFPSVSTYDPTGSPDVDFQIKSSDDVPIEAHTPLFPGLLLAVMKTKDKTYYVWNTVDSSSDATLRNANGISPIRLTTV